MVISKYEIPARIENDFKFIFISDIHNADIEPILKTIQENDAETVLVGGDFIHDSDYYEKGLEVLARSSKMKPTFVSLGNHERKFKGDLLPLILQTGATLLDHAVTTFHGIHIGGLSSGYDWKEEQANSKKTPTPNLKWLSEFAKLRGYKILLSHHPEYYPKYIKELPIDLTLSGHAHGGQWCFFGRGVYAPGQGILPKYTHGMHDGKFIVSRGLSILNPIPRINNKPEIIVIQLEPQN
jgi:predicted MPP superfamily phosphohydrolase